MTRPKILALSRQRPGRGSFVAITSGNGRERVFSKLCSEIPSQADNSRKTFNRLAAPLQNCPVSLTPLKRTNLLNRNLAIILPTGRQIELPPPTIRTDLLAVTRNLQIRTDVVRMKSPVMPAIVHTIDRGGWVSRQVQNPKSGRRKQ